MATVILVIILAVSGKSYQLSSKNALLKTILVGGLLASHWMLFFVSARLSTASVCLAGMATTSFWTSLIEPLYFKKKVEPFEVILSLIALAGMLVIFNVEFDFMVGLSLAIIAAMLAAWFSIINVTLTKNDDHFVITFYEMLFACLFVIAFSPIHFIYLSEQPIKLPTQSDWFYLLILSGICTVYAFSYSVKLMQRITAFAMNLTINLEPVYGILLALLFFGEREKMSTGFYLGTLLILISVLVYPVLNKRLKRKALEADLLR
jgi:drug/metabolite transporter (DMT)-like permease